MIGVLLVLAACLAGASILGGLIVGSLAAGRYAAWRADREHEWIRDQLRTIRRDSIDG